MSAPLAIVAAMEEELAAVVASIDAHEVIETGGRTFYRSLDRVAVVSRIGKVAAAATTAILVERFAPRAIVMIGLAGALDPGLAIGDVVIADRLIQHDLDARPLFPRHEAPGLGISEFPVDEALAERLARAELPTVFGRTPRVHRGMIASGDRFIASVEAVAELRAMLPDALAVEMEGAAIAQVCYEHGVPFAVARVISDTAGHDAAVDFARFLRDACGPYATAFTTALSSSSSDG